MVRCACRTRSLKPAAIEYIASRIVAMYYGCECRRNRIMWRRVDLANTFGISLTSVARILTRFRKNKLQPLVDQRTKGKGRPSKLTAEVIEWLMTSDMLTSMKHLNLKERSVFLRSHYDIDISYSALRSYYLKNEIRYKKADLYSLNKISRHSEILRKQLQFVVEV